MKNKQNLHIHSTWSDGINTPRELIEEAIARGFDSIGFSEHSYMYFRNTSKQLYISDMPRYQQEIRQLKAEYKGKINVFCGLEFDYYSRVPLDGFDYRIGSLHYLDFDGEILGFDRKLDEVQEYLRVHFGGDSMAFAKRYYEELSHLPEKGKFDILGHFDLLTKNNEQERFLDTADPNYIRMGLDAIHALQGEIPLFEVNTGVMARAGRSYPYPQMAFVREFKNCGFGAVISSDCHNKDHLDNNFEDARLLLEAAGFTTRWILTDNGFEEVPL